MGDLGCFQVQRRPIERAGTETLAAQLATLRHEHAEPPEDFTAAVFSAAMSASLRWPETAKLFDRMSPTC
jgi:hypothetical protein